MLESLFSQLLGSPLLIFVLVVVAVVWIGSEWSKAGKKSRRRNWKGKQRSGWKPPRQGLQDLTNATEQLQVVMQADFYSRSLLNQPESKVFKALDEAVIARNPAWQVMAQVSLGEFLGSKNKRAYGCVNSKRVDFALMDENCCVLHALEYQGGGHHNGSTAAARDAVKKEALRKAGIGYHEIVAGHTTPSELRALVEKLVPAG